MPWTGRRFYVMNDDMFGVWIVSHSDSIYHVERRAIRRLGGGCPFDPQDADVILRSSDGVDFHLHRAILSLPDHAPIKPTVEPVVETPDELGEIISVLVDKYDAESIIPPAKEHLKRYIVDEPLAAYVIAYTIRWRIWAS
ncbi:hypothetical protein B0H14DRAFT_3461620 [Mycena olivaceomarginata]|nr:hypothetical protein B0H14DRAFT_3461620 [Mycena olivaceomarginata]